MERVTSVLLDHKKITITKRCESHMNLTLEKDIQIILSN